MAYTGTGTSADPYIVDNWEDFKTVGVLSGKYIQFDPNAENKVIDINDTSDRTGMTANFALRSHVEGNGWTIRNLSMGSYLINNSYTTVYKINNLHFHNLIISRSKGLFSGPYNVSNCQFTGLLLGHNNFFSGSSSAALSDCSFHFHIAAPDGTATLFDYVKMDRCNVVLTGQCASMLLAETSYMRNCKFSGSLTLNGGTLTVSSTSSDKFNVVALQVGGTGTVKASHNASGVCIIDTEQLADTITASITGTNWQALTTAQMQDVEYLLNTVGFPCVSVE